MGLSGSGINEENHNVNGSWIAWLIDDSIGAILPVPFCPYHFVQEPSSNEKLWTKNFLKVHTQWLIQRKKLEHMFFALQK